MSTAEPQLPVAAPTTESAALVASSPQQVELTVPSPADATSAAPATPQTNNAAAFDEALNCQWSGCGERLGNAEALYDHVCERHVGRKSTNNLNLTCQWGACRTTTVKRDHITSHMRVHVPLKPHKCEFCGKSFKRPQDLKKHVKTHADDSVLLRSPDGNMNVQQNGQSFNGDNKTYFPGHDLNAGGYPGGQGHNVGGGFNNGYPNPGGYNGYGQVNYPANTNADQQSMDTRRRAIEALNDFLGDVKRRALDPHAYYDVGQRLNTNALPLPVSIGQGYSIGNGYNGGAGNGGHHQQHSNAFGNLMDSFGGSGQGMGVNQLSGGVAGPMTQNYALPVSNARTKTDLLDIDRFLEQLQSTVYESSNQASASGIQQAGVHPFGNNFNHGYNTGSFRASNSPPHAVSHHAVSATAASHGLASIAQLTGLGHSNASMDTPALTPSSVSSYASSGHSPMSSHSRSSGDGSSMYPQLPSVSAMSEMGSSYSSTPPAGLASGFDGYDARRYSGGRLQREAPAPTANEEDAMDVDDGSSTPRKMSLIKEALREPSTSANVDPALRSGSPTVAAETSPKSESADDKAQEAWVENVRVIEQLRSWINERLERHDFEHDADSTPEPLPSKQEEMADALPSEEGSKTDVEDEPVAYPTLKKED